MIAARHLLTWRLLPWQLVIGVGVLFLLVQFAHDHGLGAALTYVASHGLSGVELVRLSGRARSARTWWTTCPATSRWSR
jgi:arsenical pump membrane protein